jgi:hypothetical protein
MRPLGPLHFAVILAGLAACALGKSDYVGEPGSGTPGVAPSSQGDAGSPNGDGTSSGGASSGGTSGTSSGGTSSGGTDAGAPADSGSDAAKPDAAPPPPDSGGLDPLLSLPDPSGVDCVPGLASENGCPNVSVCRISSPSGGRCESCTNCGNLHAACSSGKDCDILFECYAGSCTNFCQLGTYECGPIADCLNVGHPTIGVCRP